MDTVSQESPSVFDVIHPLDEFYKRGGKPLPPYQKLDGSQVPEPFKGLLVHKNDMTPTLEKFHGARIHIRVLGKTLSENQYYREVVLLLDESEKPVEFGAIRINLDRFPEEAREAILGETLPLGTILADFKIDHTSRPKAFLKVASDPMINEALGLTGAWGACILYGRRNTLYDHENHPIAEIVEVLPMD
ncbi:hypothetical protein N9B94_03780 [Verrucomicrobia bacterium]|nr:hypothetical protein [Verrucomicrobiota bacterium]